MEKRLQQSQKMEAIGTLAGGIAHDFNNILMASMGYAEMIEELVDQEGEAHELLKELATTHNRAKDLVSHILAFSRRDKMEKRPINPKKPIEEVVRIVSKILPSSISQDHEIEPKCGKVFANETQLQHVTMNLVTNAYQAMQDTGILKTRLGQVNLQGEAAEALSLDPGPYVQLTVSDTGTGMDETTVKRIFEPFFTTKEPGKGTGLGLSTTYGIVTDLGGAISVQSQPGEGTTFEVYLPVFNDTGSTSGATNDDYPIASVQVSDVFVMVVDDDHHVLRSYSRLLKRNGYVVSSFQSSLEALD